MQGASPLASPRLNPRGTYNPCQAGARRGACPLCRLPTLPLVCFLSPIPPTPFPAGRGRPKVYFAGGFAPGTPALNRLRHLQTLPSRHRRGDLFSASPVRCKTDRTAFLLAVPAAKERGDRGRWNYPSQATAAFEMVLSPGAGRASAVGGKPPPGNGATPQPQQKKQSPEPRTNLPPQQLYSRKVLGGLGASFKKPPTYP